jgi:hypothetical protein
MNHNFFILSVPQVKMSSQQQTQNTNQETQARGSYISVAASVTSKLKCFCCTDCSTVDTTTTERPITITGVPLTGTMGIKLNLPEEDDSESD